VESDLQQNVNDYLVAITEAHPLVHLLKASCSQVRLFTSLHCPHIMLNCSHVQGIVAPVWMWLKMYLLSGQSFKDVKLGWLVYIVFESQAIHVIHQKKEQSNHDEENPPRAPGEFDFEFTWQLKMTFDANMETMTGAAFGISNFATTKFCDVALAKKLEKKVKSWRIDSFVAAEAAVVEKARAMAAQLKQPSVTTFAPSTYDDFRKAVQKESDVVVEERPSREKESSGREKRRSLRISKSFDEGEAKALQASLRASEGGRKSVDAAKDTDREARKSVDKGEMTVGVNAGGERTKAPIKHHKSSGDRPDTDKETDPSPQHRQKILEKQDSKELKEAKSLKDSTKSSSGESKSPKSRSKSLDKTQSPSDKTD